MGVFFKGLAEGLQITVLVCSGLDFWTHQRDDWRPQRTGLSGFGLPEEYCSIIAFTYRRSMVRPDLENLHDKAEIILTNTRTGRTGALAMAWDKTFAQFASVRGAARFGMCGPRPTSGSA
jgi:replicative DNA helicase